MPESAIDTTGLSLTWRNRLNTLAYAFQPIVNVHSGETFGVEALLRGTEEAGFSSIESVFDAAWADGVLDHVDSLLRKRAIESFLGADLPSSVRLFFNLDSRLLPDAEAFSGEDVAPLEPTRFCFELSERYPFGRANDPSAVLISLRNSRFGIAVDDFGSGYAGLKLLYHSDPDFLKIDRFFIGGIDRDTTKRLFVSNVVSMAHILGIRVVAEGVETNNEFSVCRDIGCDYAQGFFVQRPTADRDLLCESYANVAELIRLDRRGGGAQASALESYIQDIPPIPIDKPMLEILKVFRRNSSNTYFPVVNAYGEPLGVLREANLKDYVFSPHGISLLMNSTYRNEISSFIAAAPVAEVSTSLEKMIQLYSLGEDAEGIIITENGKYRGVISSRSLVQIVHQQEIAEARDQNPLTKLPGNNSISEYIAAHLDDEETSLGLVYFDFDNFKPFNDVYGFRLGDRAIQLFADMLKELSHRERVFLGHIGGDDFFLGVTMSPNDENDWAALSAQVADIQARFVGDAGSLYSADDRRRGYIEAEDRDGLLRRFPLLSVAAAMVRVPASNRERSVEELGRYITRAKKQAKTNPKGRAELEYR